MNTLNNLHSVFKNCFQAIGHFMNYAYSSINQRVHNLALSIFHAFTNNHGAYTDVDRKFGLVEILLNNCQESLKACETKKNIEQIQKLPEEILKNIDREMKELKTTYDLYETRLKEEALSILKQAKNDVLENLDILIQEITIFQGKAQRFHDFCDLLSNELKEDSSPGLNEDEKEHLTSAQGGDFFKILVSHKKRLLHEKIEHIKSAHLERASNILNEMKPIFTKKDTAYSLTERLGAYLEYQPKMKSFENKLSVISSIFESINDWCTKNDAIDLKILAGQAERAIETESQLLEFIKNLEADKSKLTEIFNPS